MSDKQGGVSDNHWMPTGTIEMLKRRAAILRDIRRYFEERNVLEVETPILSQFAGTDVNLAQWRTDSGYTLQTSPEFAMKRLLAAGSGDIFQIARVFRREEESRRHNPEFTMLEWYRLSFDEHRLMDEVADHIRTVSNRIDLSVQKVTYREAFLNANLPDPLRADLTELRDTVDRQLNADSGDWTRDDCLNALMSMVVEPSFLPTQLTFVSNFPASQAALARFGIENGSSIGRRFECFWQGLELANGYFELTDVDEQRRRFQVENETRQTLQRPLAEIDERFLAALNHGLPECAGVALGVDRLVMAITSAHSIEEVIAFPIERA